jgi:DNA topoisomerase-1
VTVGRIRRVSPELPGIRRRRRGRGFSYEWPTGEAVRESAVLERMRALAIPPAWIDVWICPSENGHLQAVGTDAAGRRQYRYHQRWQQRRQRRNFDRMLEFARALPELRAAVAADLARSSPDRRRVLAAAIRLLDLGFFRIGSETYAERNGSFGLATLKRAHVTVRGDSLLFDYTAKGGKRRVQQIRDPDVARLGRTLKRRRDDATELLAFREGGAWRDVRSTDVNEYLREIAGGDFTAKDFRTWHATVLAAVALARRPPAPTRTGKRRAVKEAIDEVATFLGNTPTVCRTSYIDPRVIDRYWDGWTIEGVLRLGGSDADPGDDRAGDRAVDATTEQVPREAIEAAVVDLVEERETPAVSRAA